MPVYSYRCTECGEAFDIRQEFTDDSLTECPNCGGKLRKLYNTVGVTFNGSGFYRNDSRPAEKSESSSSASSASSSSSSSDSKPASGSEGTSSSPAPASTAAPASKD